jgi:hypothetical protein
MAAHHNTALFGWPSSPPARLSPPTAHPRSAAFAFVARQRKGEL